MTLLRTSLFLIAAVAAAALPARVATPPEPPPVTPDHAAVARVLAPPLGLPPVPVPAANPVTAEKVLLGRKLFFDRRLSRNGTMSCAMCHVPEQGFTSHEMRTAVGLEGKSLLRNSPTLLNVAYVAALFHDGREPDLDLQAFDVLLNPDEMGAPSLGAVVASVRALPDYAPLFADAFGGEATVEGIGQALGTYMRTLLAAGSPFDRWHFGGDPDALSTAARRGFALFAGRAGCSSCHTVGADHALFTDGAFHDTGIGHLAVEARRARRPVRVELAPGIYTEVAVAVLESVGDPLPDDPGRQGVTGEPADRWRFRTPTLRNVALTAPYMHDGSLRTLREVVAHYDRGGAPGHPGLDPVLRPLGLSAREADDLVAFLESLTSPQIAELIAEARAEAPGNPGSGHPGGGGPDLAHPP
jgi:cytochrome c peroxidase